MDNVQTIAVKFLNGGWRLFSIPNKAAPNGDKPVHLNLDMWFVDRDTSIRFAGYTQNGRLLYKEMNLPRKVPRRTKNKVDYYACEDIKTH